MPAQVLTFPKQEFSSEAAEVGGWDRKRIEAWLEKQGKTSDQLTYDWDFFSRPEQRAPEGDWRIWLIKAGRGWGKGRTAAEWIRERIEAGSRRLAFVARTSADVRDTMIEGESGILSVFPPHQEPKYEPSKRRVTFHTGATATGFSADEPRLLRGPQHDTAWVDELAAWDYPDAWTQLMFGLRLGLDPRCVVSTTPRPVKLIRNLLKRDSTIVTGGSTYDNRSNLAPAFFEEIISEYEGTTIGQQEIHAQMMEESPGALWNRAMFASSRVKRAPDLVRIIVAIDPSVTSEGNEAGIVVGGVSQDGDGYILADFSKQGSPNSWGARAVEAYHEFEADRLVAERNNGGEMIEFLIKTIDPKVSYKAVYASRGKRTRAEPIASLYEQGRVHHVGVFEHLEDQLATWTPGEESPDRLDALVWCLTELMLGAKRVGKISVGTAGVVKGRWAV